MSLIFKLDSRKRIILNKECIRLCPDLTKISEDELITIILAYDYNSPYHQFPQEERLRKAIRHVYGKDNNTFGKKKTVAKAIENIKSLRYDYRRELVDTYRSKIFMLQTKLNGTMDNKDIGLILDSITKLNTSIERMQREIDKTDDFSDIKGGTVLSLLEKLQQNKELFYKHARTNEKQISASDISS